MSKKVVHLSDDAHELAKAYCKDSGMKMSDWVAMLIKRAVDPVPAPAAMQHTVAPAPTVMHPAIREPVRETHAQVMMPTNHNPPMSARPQSNGNDEGLRSLQPKKKPMLRELSSENDDVVPVYAQPPFWARSKSS